MATLYTNDAYPHSAVIERIAVVPSVPPFVPTVTPIWSGPCDCQVGINGTTQVRDTVFVSDYTIYMACIDAQIFTGDRITITQKVGWSPIVCTIEQFTTDQIWIKDGVAYGTTIWVSEVK